MRFSVFLLIGYKLQFNIKEEAVINYGIKRLKLEIDRVFTCFVPLTPKKALSICRKHIGDSSRRWRALLATRFAKANNMRAGICPIQV